jgi:hypothetical protein
MSHTPQLYNRLNTHNLSISAKQQELNIIHNMLYNNTFTFPCSKNYNATQRKPELDRPKQKLIIFKYVGNATLFITKLFKHTDLKIAFKSNKPEEHKLNSKDFLPTTIHTFPVAYVNLNAVIVEKHILARLAVHHKV